MKNRYFEIKRRQFQFKFNRINILFRNGFSNSKRIRVYSVVVYYKLCILLMGWNPPIFVNRSYHYQQAVNDCGCCCWSTKSTKYFITAAFKSSSFRDRVFEHFRFLLNFHRWPTAIQIQIDLTVAVADEFEAFVCLSSALDVFGGRPRRRRGRAETLPAFADASVFNSLSFAPVSAVS